MGLTTGSGPFGTAPAGRHNAGIPERFVLVEPFGRRVRASRGGRLVVDSDTAALVHVSGALPRYSLPRRDVAVDADVAADADIGAAPDPEVAGNVVVPWQAVDAWYEEDERVFVHPRDPYHRIDTFLSSRLVEVRLGGETPARSTRGRVLFETGLPRRWYLPRADLRLAGLEPSARTTECPYKGTARYYSALVGNRLADDVAWSYEDEVRREGEPVRWLVAFDDAKVELLVDGSPERR